jgi:hypothetical protein
MTLSIILGNKRDTVIGVISDGVCYFIFAIVFLHDFLENRYIWKQDNLPVSPDVVFRKNLFVFYVCFLQSSD